MLPSHLLLYFLYFMFDMCCFFLSIYIVIRGVARIMEKYRHNKPVLVGRTWSRSRVSMGQSPRKLTGYTTERVTFLTILEVLLTTLNSDYFVPF